MKIKSLAILLAILAVSTSLVATGYCVWYVWSARQSMMTQAEIARLNAKGQVVRALVAESIDYSRTHPNIVPVLQGLNFLPRQTNAPAATGTRPATR